MAHIEKFQGSALGNMCGHYERRAELEGGYCRENIDPARTSLNYNLQPRDCSQVEFIQARIDSLHLKRAPRKDAVRMVDTVVTLPSTYAGDVREFMEATKETLDEIFGQENCVSAWVHMDETTPHMHYACVPVTEDGRLSAKSLLSRSFMQCFHTRLEEGVCARLGVERAGLTLTDEERGQRAGKYVGLAEYKAAKEQVAQETQRLESVRQEIEELEPLAQGFLESAGTLWTSRGSGSREEELRREVEGLRSRLSASERENQRAGERVEELERGMPALRERCERARERFAVAEQRVRAAVERLTEVPNIVSEWAQKIANELGKRIYDQRSLDRVVSEARQASREISQNRIFEVSLER